MIVIQIIVEMWNRFFLFVGRLFNPLKHHSKDLDALLELHHLLKDIECTLDWLEMGDQWRQTKPSEHGLHPNALMIIGDYAIYHVNQPPSNP